MACNRPDCNNGRRDGDETEIDCGGSCPDCPPSVTTKPISSLAINSVTLSMDYYHSTGTSKSSEGFMEKGFCYGTTAKPTKNNFVISTTGTFNASGDYTTSITGLTSGTTYYVRAYVKDETAIAYGNEISFTTLSSGITVTTDSATAIALSTATCGGNVTTVGGISIIQKGLCYGTAPAPTIANNVISSGPSPGSFTTSLTGLAYPTTYYVRAYANYSGGTIYGNEVSFTTGTVSVPTVSTSGGYTVTATSCSDIYGDVTNSGNATVTARGFCYGTTPNPTLSNFITNNGTGTGLYTSNLSNLSPNTTYYVRAYATNIAGTGYGNQISFTTNDISIPTLSTLSATSITTNAAISGGNISSDGGTIVTSRGICYNTTGSPTTSNSVVLSGSGSGSFNSNLTGLTALTTYYVRAYATNSIGTAYGNQVSFSTTSPFTIGQSYQGGLIAYIDGSGLHGIIVPLLSQSNGIKWFNGVYNVTGATSTQLGNGQNNTNLIISTQGNTGSYAAKLCQDLVIGGYSDWYLPSLQELQKLYDNRAVIGGFGSFNYWSSSEFDASRAWSINFTTGTSVVGLKSSLFGVQAIRSF